MEMRALILKNDEKIRALFQRLSAKFSQGQLVKYDDLNSFPILLRSMLDVGIHTKRLPMPPDSGIYFQVDFQKESELGAHKHDCFEHITVERGAFIDLETGKIYEEGDELKLAPDVIHNIKSLDHYTILYILFTRDDAY
jgi:hypothetical protein